LMFLPWIIWSQAMSSNNPFCIQTYPWIEKPWSQNIKQIYGCAAPWSCKTKGPLIVNTSSLEESAPKPVSVLASQLSYGTFCWCNGSLKVYYQARNPRIKTTPARSSCSQVWLCCQALANGE
jgi:hypothetical protein